MTSTATILRSTEWTSAVDRSGAILRRASSAAVLQEPVVQLDYDASTGTYRLAVSAQS